MRILVVDDSIDCLELMIGVLTRKHTSIDTALSVQQACDLIRQREYDCALVDYYLDDGTGADVMRFLHDKTPETRGYIITAAHRDPGVQHQALAAGAIGVLAKPLELEALEEAVFSDMQPLGIL
jgi:CheY-like chemotaxis protein